MLFDDTYQTIKQPAEAIFRDRGSKFIAYAYPIQTESDIKPLLAQLKTVHPKANHHCWAVRLSPDRSVFRVNDDGEPSGTAGRPILNVLLSQNVTNILMVVVRYFGGTLLGVPGLINAYKTAASDALAASEIVTETVKDVYSVAFDYMLINDVMRVIKEQNVAVLKQQMTTDCLIEIAVRKMQVNTVVDKLNAIRGVKVSFNYTF